MKNKIGEAREKINQQKKRGDYQFVSEILKGEYKPDTIKKMINGERTLQPIVVEAFNKLFSMRKKLISK